MRISDIFRYYDMERLKQRGRTEKTRKNYRTTLNSFTNACGDMELKLISAAHILNWKMDMDRRGNQNSSMASNLSHMREILKFAIDLGYDALDPKHITLPKIQRKQPTWLDVSEIAAMLSVISSPRDKAILACLFSSGARISELLQLDREAIHDGEAEITGKGGKLGTLRFDDVALRYLQEYLDTRTDRLKPLFISGQRRRITVSRVQQLLHEYADEAGIEKNVTPHVLRHSFATDLKLNGADIYEVKNQLRHSQISSTMIYVHVGDKKNKAVYNTFHSRLPKP